MTYITRSPGPKIPVQCSWSIDHLRQYEQVTTKHRN